MPASETLRPKGEVLSAGNVSQAGKERNLFWLVCNDPNHGLEKALGAKTEQATDKERSESFG